MGLKSWQNAGFIVSLENEVPTIEYDLLIILDKKTAPKENLLVKPSLAKRKREKIFFSAYKKPKVAATQSCTTE